MPKYIIKEGILSKFVTKVFDNIIKGKQKQNRKAMEADPKLQAMEKDLEKRVGNFISYLKKNRKTSKDDYYADLYKDM